MGEKQALLGPPDHDPSQRQTLNRLSHPGALRTELLKSEMGQRGAALVYVTQIFRLERILQVASMASRLLVPRCRSRYSAHSSGMPGPKRTGNLSSSPETLNLPYSHRIRSEKNNNNLKNPLTRTLLLPHIGSLSHTHRDTHFYMGLNSRP